MEMVAIESKTCVIDVAITLDDILSLIKSDDRFDFFLLTVNVVKL
jgi:hypothetical protein